jgi:hypothetical protein
MAQSRRFSGNAIKLADTRNGVDQSSISDVLNLASRAGQLIETFQFMPVCDAVEIENGR